MCVCVGRVSVGYGYEYDYGVKVWGKQQHGTYGGSGLSYTASIHGVARDRFRIIERSRWTARGNTVTGDINGGAGGRSRKENRCKHKGKTSPNIEVEAGAKMSISRRRHLRAGDEANAGDERPEVSWGTRTRTRPAFAAARTIDTAVGVSIPGQVHYFFFGIRQIPEAGPSKGTAIALSVGPLCLALIAPGRGHRPALPSFSSSQTTSSTKQRASSEQDHQRTPTAHWVPYSAYSPIVSIVSADGTHIRSSSIAPELYTGTPHAVYAGYSSGTPYAPYMPP